MEADRVPSLSTQAARASLQAMRAEAKACEDKHDGKCCAAETKARTGIDAAYTQARHKIFKCKEASRVGKLTAELADATYELRRKVRHITWSLSSPRKTQNPNRSINTRGTVWPNSYPLTVCLTCMARTPYHTTQRPALWRAEPMKPASESRPNTTSMSPTWPATGWKTVRRFWPTTRQSAQAWRTKPTWLPPLATTPFAIRAPNGSAMSRAAVLVSTLSVCQSTSDAACRRARRAAPRAAAQSVRAAGALGPFAGSTLAPTTSGAGSTRTVLMTLMRTPIRRWFRQFRRFGPRDMARGRAHSFKKKVPTQPSAVNKKDKYFN